MQQTAGKHAPDQRGAKHGASKRLANHGAPPPGVAAPTCARRAGA
ncbi:hypothetical protein C7S14_3394 [Burkholderia cepacia]|nr:hypothetical protein C7S14_3394 [Burkholderia cepacia]